MLSSIQFDALSHIRLYVVVKIGSCFRLAAAKYQMTLKALATRIQRSRAVHAPCGHCSHSLRVAVRQDLFIIVFFCAAPKGKLGVEGTSERKRAREE